MRSSGANGWPLRIPCARTTCVPTTCVLLDLTMGQRKQFFRILQEFGLTPGDLRALSTLDQEPPAPCGPWRGRGRATPPT
jgi:hypothetical protein